MNDLGTGLVMDLFVVFISGAIQAGIRNQRAGKVIPGTETIATGLGDLSSDSHSLRNADSARRPHPSSAKFTAVKRDYLSMNEPTPTTKAR